jgi:hypothetical protein
MMIFTNKNKTRTLSTAIPNTDTLKLVHRKNAFYLTYRSSKTRKSTSNTKWKIWLSLYRSRLFPRSESQSWDCQPNNHFQMCRIDLLLLWSGSVQCLVRLGSFKTKQFNMSQLQQKMSLEENKKPTRRRSKS